MKNNILIKLCTMFTISLVATYIHASECPVTAQDSILGNRSLSSVVILNGGSGSGEIICLYGKTSSVRYKTELKYNDTYSITSPGNWQGYPGGQECINPDPRQCQFFKD